MVRARIMYDLSFEKPLMEGMLIVSKIPRTKTRGQVDLTFTGEVLEMAKIRTAYVTDLSLIERVRSTNFYFRVKWKAEGACKIVRCI